MTPFKKGDYIIATRGETQQNGGIDYTIAHRPLQVVLVAEAHMVLYDPILDIKVARTLEEIEMHGFIIANEELIDALGVKTA